jgi:hypothetical protein
MENTENTIVLQTFKGTNVATGEEVVYDLDEVKVNGQRVAFVPHVEGAQIRTLRQISPPTLAKIVEAVKAQRAAQNKPAISDKVSEPPTPEEMRAAAKQLKKGA